MAIALEVSEEKQTNYGYYIDRELRRAFGFEVEDVPEHRRGTYTHYTNVLKFQDRHDVLVWKIDSKVRNVKMLAKKLRLLSESDLRKWIESRADVMRWIGHFGQFSFKTYDEPLDLFLDDSIRVEVVKNITVGKKNKEITEFLVSYKVRRRFVDHVAHHFNKFFKRAA